MAMFLEGITRVVFGRMLSRAFVSDACCDSAMMLLLCHFTASMMNPLPFFGYFDTSDYYVRLQYSFTIFAAHRRAYDAVKSNLHFFVPAILRNQCQNCG